jgi:hypothetical protein
LIAIGLLDVFFVVLAYDATSLVVEPGYRLLWRVVNRVARHLPARTGGFLRSMAAPLMVVGSVAVWMSLQIVGFALLYYPGVTSGGFALHGLARSFWTSLYLSAATISSLAFNGGQPAHTGFFFLGATETLIGVTILSLTIAYILGLYGVVQDAAVAWVTMQNHAGRDDSAASLLAPHFRASSAEGLSALWRDLQTNLAGYLEGMRRYPVVYYFHTRSRSRSLPAMLRLTGEAASAVRWGLPSAHPAVSDPWLPGVLETYQQAAREITGRFLTVEPATPGPAADEPVFRRCADGAACQVASAEEFLAVQALMSQLAGVGPGDLGDDSFERYLAWWRFAAPAHAFADAVAADFGETPNTRPSRIGVGSHSAADSLD